jgi:hypothetical protein
VVDKTTNAGDNVVQLALSFADRFERRGPSIAEGILPQEQERIEEAATRPQSAESRMYLRQGTDPGHRKFLGPICDIVARIR